MPRYHGNEYNGCPINYAPRALGRYVLRAERFIAIMSLYKVFLKYIRRNGI
jgi:hypothetical protein